MTTPLMFCLFCNHFKGNQSCDAFQDGIPDEIFMADILHDKPYPGDSGILFGRVTEEELAEIMEFTQ